ncbi:hypothetical protein NSS79_06970 [Paenibacillus sp. FSL L8-0436]
MLKFLPPAKSNRWFVWFLIYTLILWLLLALHRFLLLGENFDLPVFARFAALALVVSGILHSFGWFGAKLVWLISTIGIVFGLGTMYQYTYQDMSGWEDLAGFLSLIVFTAGGFVLGLIVEGSYLLIRKLRKP